MTHKKRISIIVAGIAIAVLIVAEIVTYNNVKTARKNYNIYGEGIQKLSVLVHGISKYNDTSQQLTYIRDNRDDAVKSISDIRKVCDYFEKVRVPSKLKSKCAEIRAAIPALRQFADSMEKVFDTQLESEFEENINAALDSLKTVDSNDGIRSALKSFMSKLDDLWNKRKGRLIWI